VLRNGSKVIRAGLQPDHPAATPTARTPRTRSTRRLLHDQRALRFA
jgi:hypothetical protein